MRLSFLLCIAGISPGLKALSLLRLFDDQSLQGIPGELLPTIATCRNIVADGPEFDYEAEPVCLDRFHRLLQSVRVLLNYALVNPESVAEPGAANNWLQSPAIKPLGRLLLQLLNMRNDDGLLWQGFSAPRLRDEHDEGQIDRPSSQPKLKRSLVVAEFDVQQWALKSILRILEQKLSSDQSRRNQLKLVAVQTNGLAELCTVRGLLWQIDGASGDAVELIAGLRDQEFRNMLFELEKELGGLPKMLRNVWTASQEPAAVEIATLKRHFKWEGWLENRSAFQTLYRGVNRQRERLTRRMIKIGEVVDRAIATLRVEAIRLRGRLELSSIREWAERASGKVFVDPDQMRVKAGESLQMILDDDPAEAVRRIEEGLGASECLSLDLLEGLKIGQVSIHFLSTSVALFELSQAMWGDVVSWDGLVAGLEKITAILAGITRLLEAGMERFGGLDRDRFVLELVSDHFASFVSGAGMLIKTLEETSKDPKPPLEECRKAYDRLLAQLDQMVPPMADCGEDGVMVTPKSFSTAKHPWESIFGDLRWRK